MTVVLPAELLAFLLIGLTAVIFGTLLFAVSQWRELVVAIARRKLFEARDEIFFLFATSKLGVEHPAHREVRDRLNILIRHAHKMAWWRVFVVRLVLKDARDPAQGRLPEFAKLEAADHHLYAQVERRMHDGHHAVFELMSRRLLPIPALVLVDIASRTVIRKLRLESPASDAAVDKIALAADAEDHALACGWPKAA